MKNLSKHISMLYRHTQIYYSNHLSNLGIGSGQFMYILCICEHEGLSQDELSHELSMNKSTVAKILRQLEKTNFITRMVNERDKRIFNIYPTEKAKGIYQHIITVQSSWYELLLANLSEIESDAFEKLLEKVTENSIVSSKH